MVLRCGVEKTLDSLHHSICTDSHGVEELSILVLLDLPAPQSSLYFPFDRTTALKLLILIIYYLEEILLLVTGYYTRRKIFTHIPPRAYTAVTVPERHQCFT